MFDVMMAVVGFVIVCVMAKAPHVAIHSTVDVMRVRMVGVCGFFEQGVGGGGGKEASPPRKVAMQPYPPDPTRP